MAKYIVTEGTTDSLIINSVITGIRDHGIEVHVANGFSNVIAVAKTLADYGHDVLMIIDTDTNIPGIDNRSIMERMNNMMFTGRQLKVVWMDPDLEHVMSRVCPVCKGMSRHHVIGLASMYKEELLKLNEFEKIQKFVSFE